ncbi:flagellar biosynthesis protein FlhB [Priestia megaterium]|nr:flagellar biosynthesis protein FlhB [Priestia megaterium]
MAKDGKTEKATPRKKKEAREKGNLPQSKEMALFFNLIGFTFFIAFFGSWFVKKIISMEQVALDVIDGEIDIFRYFELLGKESLGILIPMAGLTIAFVFLNYLVQVRFLFAPKAIKPDVQKISPKQFFSNLFNRKTFVQIIKQVLIVTVLGYIVYAVFFNRATDISLSVQRPWDETLTVMWGIFKEVIYKILIALFVIAILDFFYQRWEYEESLKMKKEEIKRDRKDTEGDPEVKFRQNQRRIAILKNDTNKKMKSEVTFITTNPTHYAVAIYFKPGRGNPKVVLKGVDHMALYIKEIAKKYEVPIYEDPPLTRELYSKVLENEEIPEEMWAAIALVIRKLIERKELKI